MISESNTPPAPWTHPHVGAEPEYKPSAGLIENFGGVPALITPDMHDEPARDEAIEDIESAEDCKP